MFHRDKRLHLEAGFIIAAIVGSIVSVGLGVLAGVLAGILKEVYDYFDYGLFDRRDVIFTTAGALLGGLIVAI